MSRAKEADPPALAHKTLRNKSAPFSNPRQPRCIAPFFLNVIPPALRISHINSPLLQGPSPNARRHGNAPDPAPQLRSLVLARADRYKPSADDDNGGLRALASRGATEAWATHLGCHCVLRIRLDYLDCCCWGWLCSGRDHP